jgi:hypothetical protein
MYICSLSGGDFDEAIGIIEGTGSGEFDGDYFRRHVFGRAHGR